MHPLAASGACDKVIAAHTIQRNGALAAIVDSRRHVLSFYPADWDASGRLKLQSVGWRDASTFPAFCARHDDDTFAAIEKQSFRGTSEQAFLLAYRALCHELYQKTASDETHPRLRHQLDRGLPRQLQRSIQKHYEAFGSGVAKGVEDARKLKEFADDCLLRRDYAGWQFINVYFRGQLSIASTGSPTPTFDLEGNSLQLLHDLSTNVQPLFYATLPTEVGGVVVFSWPGHMQAPARFLESLLAQPWEKLPDLMVQFMFTHVENTYFSRAWWEALPSHSKAAVRTYAAIVNPYYDPLKHSGSGLVDWEIASIERS